ncbi:unnamed protein product [Oikopleura dioica]|uniref:Sulfatase N-terminal domain-containing protein n=1 Tax=Oikopleura dioica TaxID=34765 RepID=E4YW48_OIKDI|nr:unnamed protein product [Oikopleura dioica]
MSSFFFYLFLFCSTFSQKVLEKKPHVIFVLVDDLGFDDLGYVNRDVISPNIDALAKDALHLKKHYVQPSCTPSRAAFLTGRYNIRMGMQSGVIRATEPEGIPLRETLLSEAFKQCGYRTSLQGKWHLGFYTYKHCPQIRGFDRFYGFYLGSQDFYFHDSGRLKAYPGNGDVENDTILDDLHTNGTYSTKLFVDDFINDLAKHDPAVPLFNYVSFQDVHGPLQTVNKFKKHYENKTDTWTHERILISTKITTLDHHIGKMVTALKEKNYWNNTVLVFTSDNGGQPKEGASNWPLRGSKGTIYDGGLKSRAFIASPLLQNRMKGQNYNYLFHVSDWFPTLLTLSGCDVPRKEGRPLDGKIHELFVYKPKKARNKMLHYLDPLSQFDYGDPRHFEVLDDRAFNTTIKASYRQGRWKIITGKPCGNGCGYIKNERPWNYAKNKMKLIDMPKEKNKNVWLYDMHKDKSEKFDRSAQKPWVVNRLLTKLADLYDEQVMPQRREASDAANPKHHGGVWMPWRKNEIFDYTEQSYRDNFSIKESTCLFNEKTLDELVVSPAFSVDLRKLQKKIDGQKTCFMKHKRNKRQ